MKLTENFDLSEFAVSGSHPELVEPVPLEYWDNVERLVTSCLQPIRDLWGKPMKVLSGYRSEKLNAAVGGSPTSQHRYAQEADITTDDVRGLYSLLLTEDPKFPTGQVIGYPAQRFIHIALPSEKYPKPAFFISPSKKNYVRVSSLSAFGALWPR